MRLYQKFWRSERASYLRIRPPTGKKCKKCSYSVPMKKGKSFRKNCSLHCVKGMDRRCEDCEEVWNTTNKCYHVSKKWHEEGCCIIM